MEPRNLGNLHVTMPDGSVWAVPVFEIAKDRAKYYAADFDGDEARSLAEDTLPLFEGDDYQIKDWAENNMNWSDVEQFARKVSEPKPVYYEEGWANGDKKVVT